MADNPLSQNTVVAGRGGGAAGAAAPAPQQSPGALALAQLLGLANTQGTMTGGTAGTAGYTISAAPQRAAEQAAFNQAEANRASVYGSAVSAVNAREPSIGQGYDNSTAAIQNQATARSTAAAGAESARNNDMASAAARFGLNFVPSNKGLANSNADAQAAKYKTNADSWAGLLGAQKNIALTGNRRTADAFTYSGTQAQAALQGLLTKALAGMQDKYVAGRAGTPGKMTGGASVKDQIGIYKTILGNQNAQDNATTNKLKAASSMTPKTSTTTKTATKGGVKSTTVRSQAAIH